MREKLMKKKVRSFDVNFEFFTEVFFLKQMIAAVVQWQAP